LKRVFSSYNQTAVYHARNLLENEGIVTLVRNAALSSAMGELPPAECQAELWVLNDSDVQRAERILLPQAVSGPDWTCSCGETLGPQFTQCWRCGAYRSAGRGL
jgi:Putative prokaryotic signal transducing protein